MSSNQALLDEAQTLYNDLVDRVMMDEPLRKEMIQVLHKLMSRIQKLTPPEGQARGLLIEKVAEAMFNWKVEEWQNLNYNDETIRTMKYRELARIAISTIFK